MSKEKKPRDIWSVSQREALRVQETNNPYDPETPPHPTDPNRNAKGHWLKGKPAGPGRPVGSKTVFSKRIVAALSEGISDEAFEQLTREMIDKHPDLVWKVVSSSALKESTVTNINIGEQTNSFFSGAPTPESFTYWDEDGVEKPDREANREEAQRWLDDLNQWALEKAESLS